MFLLEVVVVTAAIEGNLNAAAACFVRSCSSKESMSPEKKDKKMALSKCGVFFGSVLHIERALKMFMLPNV